MMKKVPQEITLDDSIALLQEGYRYIPNRCQKYGTRVFRTRLLGEKVVCISGEEAARMFYDNRLFKRKGVTPKRVQKTLFGENAIQGMDGEAHRCRKQLFMSLMTPSHLDELASYVTEEWRASSAGWKDAGEVVLFREAQKVLCRAACKWAGVPLAEEEVTMRAEDFGAMVDAFGAVGPRHWEGRKARSRAEKWIRGIITQVRSKELDVPKESSAYAMAWHTELDGQQLDTNMAAIELINILRPIVAIAIFVAYGALALYHYPENREKLLNDDEKGSYLYMFVQEVRRFYPFAPFLGARAIDDFSWDGVHFKKDQLVLLDLYGTNRDPHLWKSPKVFDPERFKDWKGGLFDLIPQGGGDYYEHHRCPGEMATIEVLKATFAFLTKEVQYDLPPQDLTIRLNRLPTYPKSGVVIKLL
ncbi:cytochrome P450 [Bacillus testis]|uniref:cytochrome P450 n=1 Tax=Bacillus testis TaxID=1622072 RepID=UPI00164D7DAD|nr:cytochrome P450 [Bacillus testis]